MKYIDRYSSFSALWSGMGEGFILYWNFDYIHFTFSEISCLDIYNNCGNFEKLRTL